MKMPSNIPKPIAKKIRKFYQTAEALRNGENYGYFSITRLTSIKSICKETNATAPFVLYVEEKSLKLRDIWSSNWEKMANEKNATNALIAEIDVVRKEIKIVLKNLS